MMRYEQEDLILKENKEAKKKVLKSLKKKIDSKKLRKDCEKKFILREVISRPFLEEVELGHFVTGNNAWGYNQHMMHMKYYKIILKEFAENKFEKKILELLNKSKNQTPQTTVKRKLPFKQKSGRYSEPALPGLDIVYSSSHNDDNPYVYKYCKQNNIDFFKGPPEQTKTIIKLGFEKNFPYLFVYGYVESAITYIFKLGNLDESSFEKPKFRRYWKGVPVNDMFYDKRFVRKKRVNIFKKLFKTSEIDAEKIIDEIENSIFQSKLSKFLITKNENYFVNTFNRMWSIDDKDFYESTTNFIFELKQKKNNAYNKGKKYKQYNVIQNKLQREKYRPMLGPVGILNYEQFRFYTFRCRGLTPYDENKLNLDEKDIFNRYVIYLGVQEFHYYINQIIFSPEL
jgi:hypothetical protein|tara:strand:+ start:82 stop:1278 length:1197 start_codon:yes stop_codon:yes gene_type:complete